MPTLVATMAPAPQVHSNERNTSDRSPAPSKTLFKKVVKYFQDQALEQKSSTLYLSPGREPQNRGHQRPVIHLSYSNLDVEDNRRFSEASTYVDTVNGFRHQYQPVLPPMPQSSRSSSTSRSNSAMSTISNAMKRHQYASDNILQSYDVYVPDRASNEAASAILPDSRKYWVVYVHGGYFRDVKVDSASFKPTISKLEQLSSDHSSASPLEDIRESVSGYASINYRLSPHPAYPQDALRTPNYELRNAKWPDQINDVLAALRHLQNRYGFDSNYILVGHSVGALLAFLAALRSGDSSSGRVAPPRAVVGVSGIYDFLRIHETNPSYEEMTRNAMAPSQYAEASPALYSAKDYESKWTLQGENGEQMVREVLLAHSRDDGLVGWDQVEEMKKLLDQCDAGSKLRCELLELKGKHNEIWEDGMELSRTLVQAVNMVKVGDEKGETDA